MNENLHFPANRLEALAIEYAKARMNENTTPEEFFQCYIDAYHRIREAIKVSRQEQSE